MRRVREVLRLHHEFGLSTRTIARSVGVSPRTVQLLLSKAQVARVGWPIPDTMTDSELETLLYPEPIPSRVRRPEPDVAAIHQELRRKGVTLQLLWLEYVDKHPDGLGYSQFCSRYRAFARTLGPTMRQVHRAGEKMFVDYSGVTVPYFDRQSGEEREADVFVATLGASGYIYAEATAGQSTADFISSHVRAFAHYGGLVRIVVPDNLKAAVIKPDRHEPELNQTYAEMARHYGIAIVPARVRRPRDKASVENGVQQVERWVLAPLRKATFFSLSDINIAMRPLLDSLNNRSFQQVEGSRRSLYEALDRPALRPLPTEPFVLSSWRKTRVGVDYHVQVDSRFYSVPFSLARQEVDVRATERVVEVYHDGQRVASHLRLGRSDQRRFATDPGHMPPAHRARVEEGEWTPSRLVRWAEKIGPSTRDLVEKILGRDDVPEHGFRSCMGILALSRHHSAERMEATAAHALRVGVLNAKGVRLILNQGMDRVNAAAGEQPVGGVGRHKNVRGAEYYRDGDR
jgi:transposase